MSTRKGTITNPGLIWNKTCILLPTCYGNPITKEKRINPTASQVSEHIILVYLTLSCCIHTEMINLRFEAWALPLNPLGGRKANRVYRRLITFSPSTINRYFKEGPSREKDILCGLSSRYGHFSGGSSGIQIDFLTPDFYLNCFVFLVLSLMQ